MQTEDVIICTIFIRRGFDSRIGKRQFLLNGDGYNEAKPKQSPK